MYAMQYYVLFRHKLKKFEYKISSHFISITCHLLPRLEWKNETYENYNLFFLVQEIFSREILYEILKFHC